MVVEEKSTRSEVVGVRLRPGERRVVDAAAALTGLSVSAFGAAALTQAAREQVAAALEPASAADQSGATP